MDDHRVVLSTEKLEARWILKPQNAELWYKSVHEWLATYLK